MRFPLEQVNVRSEESLSVGDWRLPMLRLDIDEDRLRLEEIPSDPG